MTASADPNRETTAPAVAMATTDPTIVASVRAALGESGATLEVVPSLDSLEGIAGRGDVDVILIDANLLPRNPVRFVRTLSRSQASSPLLIISTREAASAAYDLIAHGASDVLQRGLHPVEVRLRIRQAVESREMAMHLANLEEEITERSRKSFNERTLVSRSRAMARLSDTVQRVSKMRTTVLIRGESGVGKELVARALHFSSPRNEAPFIAINCAALPHHLIESELFGHERGAFTGAVSRRAGKFELAHRGTLFLDEVGETDLPTQAKLLRVLEQQEFMRVGGSRPVRVEVRLVAATNSDLEEMVREGKFREDLYYRLKVVTLDVPPLRERREDIPELAQTFLERICRQNQLPPRRLTASALDALVRYPWPGNVRELMNTLEAVVVATNSDTIDLEHLPAQATERSLTGTSGAAQLAGRSLAEIEAEAIRSTLALVDGSRTEAARLLGVSIRTLRRRIREFGLDQVIPPKPGRPAAR
jgi:DNA-binding NtrC family response regulator